jgi:hypothetical protein
MPRNNNRAICVNRIKIMNSKPYYPHAGHYRLESAGSQHYAVYHDYSDRLSSHLPWPQLAEWIDGYMVAVQEMHNKQIEAQLHA